MCIRDGLKRNQNTEEEVEKLINAPDTKEPIGLRDRAMLELIYACGLRVSELISLDLLNINLRQGVIRVIGKGEKERLVPMGEESLFWVSEYINRARSSLMTKDERESALFLSKRGSSMTRQTFWYRIKEYALKSGIEKNFDNYLKTNTEPLTMTLDKEIQFLVRQELLNSEKIFKNVGSASILMNINNGEILSLVSLPDFDINKRNNISDKKYINRATKGVYEFGSVFKTFTIAAGFDEKLIEPKDMFNNLEKKINCGGRTISEYDEDLSQNLSVEEILINSGNIGSVKIGQKLGVDKIKNFLTRIGILSDIEFDIPEIGKPIPFNWGKCKLLTVSFGHGITTTLIQLAKGYAIISNGGYDITPTLIKDKNIGYEKKNRVLSKNVSLEINKILRRVVTEGTASLADVKGYNVGGKTGTALIVENGKYTKKKINTFASIFPTNEPEYVLIIMLEDTKLSKDYVYKYRNKPGSFVGTPFNTAGWTSVEVAAKIIEKIGPILATKY